MGNVIYLNDYIKEKNIVITSNDNNYSNSVTENDSNKSFDTLGDMLIRDWNNLDEDDFELKYAKALQEYYPTYNK